MIQVGQYDTYETPPDMQQIHGCPVPAKPPKESVVELIPRAASVVVMPWLFNKKMGPSEVASSLTQ